jgi:hypothetical protein
MQIKSVKLCPTLSRFYFSDLHVNWEERGNHVMLSSSSQWLVIYASDHAETYGLSEKNQDSIAKRSL